MKKKLLNKLLLFVLIGTINLFSAENRIKEKINFEGYDRYYTIVLPNNFSTTQKYSLVIALHGGGGSGEQCEKDYSLTETANKNNFIIVYPDGVKKKGLIKLRTWNAGTCCGYAVENNINDVGFVSIIIDNLIKNYRVDSNKVFITGMSNGGMMAYKLACEIPNKISGIAVVSCTMVTNKIYTNMLPVPILHIHSLKDKKVPINGGKGIAGYYFPPVDSTLAVWKKVDQCNENTKQIIKGIDFTNYKYFNNNSKLMIDYYVTNDGGHSWPQGKKGTIFADEPATSINANELIFYFFNHINN